jgi:hypothetical protein
LVAAAAGDAETAVWSVVSSWTFPSTLRLKILSPSDDLEAARDSFLTMAVDGRRSCSEGGGAVAPAAEAAVVPATIDPDVDDVLLSPTESAGDDLWRSKTPKEVELRRLFIM